MTVGITVTTTFRYSEDGPGAYPIMAIRFSEVNKIQERCGFRRDHVIYLNLETMYATYDKREFSNKHTAEDDDYLLELLTALEEEIIYWPEVAGCTVGPNDKDVLMVE